MLAVVSTAFACAPVRLARVESAPVGGLATPIALDLPALPDAPVRNVVLLVGDGMGLAQVAAARLRAFGTDGHFTWERFPVVGLVDTRPSGGLVTKSDAAATAFACGVKTTNGHVGTAPDGRTLRSVLEAARDAGDATGVLTTSQVYDATPAAFYAHVVRRHDDVRILDQLEKAGLDFVAGGGRSEFLPNARDGVRSDARDLLDEARARGVGVVTDPAALAKAGRLPLWAIFPGSTLGEKPAHPTVGEMTAKALELLSAEAARRGKGFFLMAEEEGTDTAGHARSLERLARAVVHLDAAVADAARFAARDGHTLVLVLADHSTGGLVVDQSSTARRLRVVWASHEHGGEPVPLWAYGPAGAAARFAGSLDNTDVAHRLREILGLDGGPS